MSKLENLNPYLEVKQQTNRDVRQLGVMVSESYEAESTDQQTIINLNMSVDVNNKKQVWVFIDGVKLIEGATGNYIFTNIVNSVSAQITLSAPLMAGLAIQVYKLGAYQESFPNPSSVTANLNATNLALDTKGNKNSLINGSFDIWQRNTTFTAIADATYFADRWKYTKNVTSAVHTITRDTDVPTTAFGTYSANATIITADASVGSTDLVLLRQFIEGNFLKPLKGKNIIFQFWVKSPKTGIHCVSFLNSTQNKSLIKEYTVNAVNTWEQKRIRFSHDSTGTWLYDTGIGMGVNFVLMAGSTFQGTKDIWGTSQVYATSNQVNTCDTIGNAFKISDCVMVEDNSSTTLIPNFVTAADNLAQEFALCQRYCWKTSGIQTTMITGQAVNTTAGYFAIPISGLRATPTVSFNILQINDALSGQFAITALAIDSWSPALISFQWSVASGMTTGHLVCLQATNAASFLQFDCEL